MKGGNKLFIFAGVGLALVAVVLAITSLSGGGQTDAKKETKSEKVKVVQAKTDIEAFKILTPDQLTSVEVASDQVPADAVTNVNEVVGQTYSVPLRAGQSLSRAMVETPGLTNDIAVGKRAIALPVDDVSTLSGLVQKDDHIDIVFHARINVMRVLPAGAQIVEDNIYKISQPQIYPPDIEGENYPLAGDAGSTFVIRDDVGDLSELEPVAKIMLQDIRVLRVIRPGEQFLNDGSISEEEQAKGAAAVQQKPTGQLVLEVTPDQAEAITFMQDQKHKYQVVVRGKDDHEVVNTKGITFQILATDTEWSMPVPKTVTLPKEQPSRANSSKDKGDAKATPEASPTTLEPVDGGTDNGNGDSGGDSGS